MALSIPSPSIGARPLRALILVLLLGLAACDGAGEAPVAARGPDLTVSVVPAEVRAMSRRVVASGTVRAWEEIVIAAEAQGLAIAEVAVEEGDAVEQGAVLARLDAAVIEAQEAQGVANLAAAQAVLKEARANLARARDLQPRGTVSRQNLDARIAAERTAAAQVAVAEASLAEIRARLDQTVIRAPFAGVIARRDANVGQVVVVGGELFRLIRDGRLELEAEVPESDFARLRAGLAARVHAEGLDAPVAARLRALAPTVDPRTRLGIAHLELPADSGFKPGMFATGDIDLGAADLLMLPVAAIVWRDGVQGVFTIDGDRQGQGVARFTPVRTGLRREGLVEVRDGLAPGAAVALRGAGFLEDGDAVGVVEARS
ncbi:efflux RND transporter periplasmic adaptor subunit [Zavarzinia compransoris]|uniref:efflux RND transporter periplasmic adaptor subunit n=1 Tax=Zavarzinia marina TaxID=2911065 RepID=UPI001F18EA35|nr:efflux RND transporter periplasmic adaptor subunit [Zavarzinia marina]MCF4165477.1 efflux RND transporter periplasmic adaptor subunit [Zavarzinia marina]